MKQTVIWGTFCIVASTVLYLGYHAHARVYRGALCKNLTCITFPPTIQPSLVEVYEASDRAYRALFSTTKYLFRISASRPGANDPDNLIDANVLRMQTLFDHAPAPYPGDISDTITCDKKFKPSYHTISRNDTIRYFLGYLNDRLVFGSCSSSDSTYEGVLAFMYCPKDNLIVQLEIIKSASDTAAAKPDTILKDIKCAL